MKNVKWKRNLKKKNYQKPRRLKSKLASAPKLIVFSSKENFDSFVWKRLIARWQEGAHSYICYICVSLFGAEMTENNYYRTCVHQTRQKTTKNQKMAYIHVLVYVYYISIYISATGTYIHVHTCMLKLTSHWVSHQNNGLSRFWGNFLFRSNFFHFFFILKVCAMHPPLQNRVFSRCLKNGKVAPKCHIWYMLKF